MDGTKFVPPIVSCSPPPLAPMSPPPMTDDSDGISPDMGGFSFNTLDNESIGMGPPDLDCGALDEFDIPNIGGLDDTDEYDVTGLSEKMHSIPIEAIHALPPTQRINTVETIAVNETDTIEILEKDESPNVPIDVPQISSLTVAPFMEDKSSDKFEIGKNGYIQPSYSNSEVIEDLENSARIKNADSSVPDVENENCKALNLRDNNVNEDTISAPELAFDSLIACDSIKVEKHFDQSEDKISDSSVVSSTEDFIPEFEGNVNLNENQSTLIGSENKEINESLEQFSKNITLRDDFRDNSMPFNETTTIDDDFGDFDNAFCSSSGNEKDDQNLKEFTPATIDINQIPLRSEDPVFDDSDDDFGDFGEVVTPQDKVIGSSVEDTSSFTASHLQNTPRQSTEAILNLLEPNINTVISDLVHSVSDFAYSDQSCDAQISTQPGSSFTGKALDLRNVVMIAKEDSSFSSNEVTDNDVWLNICNLEKTPAIKLSWTQTSLIRKNFRLLNVDPENVEREIVNKRRRRKDGTELPKYASGLADTNLNSSGSALLKPTPILTPKVIKSNDSSRKPSNDSCTAEELTYEVMVDNYSYRTQENSNSTVTQLSETSKPKQTLDGLLDFDSLNNEITQASASTKPNNELDWMTNNLNDVNEAQNVITGTSDASILLSNGPLAQSQSSIVGTNFTSSTSHNSSEITSSEVESLNVIQNNQGEDKCISSSSDIFSQIGNLVRENQKIVNEQLPHSTTNDETRDKSIPTSELKTKGSTIQKRSQEASSIISAFPLLDFMQSPHLMIPLQSDNFKTKNGFSNNDTSNTDETKDQKMKIVRKDSGATVFTTTDMVSNNYNLYELNVDGNAI